MAKIKDEIIFTDFGLNQDDDLRYVGKGSTPYAMNILKGEDGASGVITNMKGNKLVSYQLGDSNTYFVLGSCYDTLTRNVYYFIFSQPYDTTGSGDYEYDNRLLQFNEDDEEITLIFRDTRNYFGLDPARPMKDPFVLGEWLYFNPITSEPKMIHLTMAYYYTACTYRTVPGYYVYDATDTYLYGDKVSYFGGLFLALAAVAVGETPVTTPAKWDRIGSVYQDESFLQFDSEFRYAFNVIKQPPAHRPICNYATDAERSFNNVKGKVFRFTHRYKYFDNTYSVWGAYSDVMLPPDDESYNGEITGNDISNNYIEVRIPLFSAALIKEIELVFQEVDGNWRCAKVINRRDLDIITDIYYTHDFYNDESYPEIDDTYINTSHDSVPRTANCQEIINKNILTYAYCKEGFNNLDKEDIDVSLTPEPVEFEVGAAVQAYGAFIYDAVGDIVYGWEDDPLNADIVLYAYALIGLNNAFLAGISVGDVFRITVDGTQYHYVLLDADDDSVQDLVVGIVAFLNTIAPNYNAIVDPLDDTYVRLEAGYGVEEISVSQASFHNTGVGEDAAYLIKQRGFKTGAWHPFCIFYYDEALRRWDAQTAKDKTDGAVAWEIDGTVVYVPLLAEYSPTPTGLNVKWVVNWEVNHLPPEGAKYWRWGYAGNTLCSYFIRYIIDDDDPIGDVAVGSAEEPINTTYINIKPLQTLTNTAENDWNKFPNSNIRSYSWESGDRIRFITEAAGANDIGAPLDTIYDYEIIMQDEANHKIYIREFDWAAAGIGAQTLVEIYCPLKGGTETVYYEFGEIMPIIEDSAGNLVHGAPIVANSQDYDLSIAATGVFTTGDVYHILRTPSCPIEDIEAYVHESMWYSDFYDSDDWDKGKTGMETIFNERYLNIVRYSYPYLQNTQINGLSTFDGDNYKPLNDVYGEILRIIEIGDTLKVYQRKKPSSILIGRTEYTDAEGNTTVAISERVLGALRYSTTNYGTEFPESIERNNRYVYGFDVYNGVLWRDSPNGIFPVSGRYESMDGGSDYKMETYFKEKAKELLVSGTDHVQVPIVWDERHKNLYVIFKDTVLEENNENIVFHEASNRWICFTDMDRTYDEGWNQILELDWWVLWGFDGGLGYSFDEDTRFAVFDIGDGLGTPETVRAFGSLTELTLTALAPDIIIDSTPVPPLAVMHVEPLVPVPISSWIDSSNENPAIAYDCDTIGEVTATGQATITAYAKSSELQTILIKINHITESWLHVTKADGVYLSIGQTLVSGTDALHDPPYKDVDLYFFSTTGGNTGAARTAQVIFEDGFGNYEIVTVHQAVNPTPPDVTVGVLGGDIWLTLTGEEGIATLGSNNITVNFTPDHGDKIAGQYYTVYWSAFITRDGIYSNESCGTGYWSNIEDEVATSETASVSIPDASVPRVGDTFYIYLSVNYVNIEDVTIDTLSLLTITPLVPQAIVSNCTITGSPISFTHDELYDAPLNDAQPFVVLKAPATATCKIIYIESWLRLFNSLGVELFNGMTPDSVDATGVGETLRVVPRTANTGGDREGTYDGDGTAVVFHVQEYGDIGKLVVYQAHAPTTFEHDTIYISSTGSAYLSFKYGSVQRIVGTDVSNELSMSFCIESTLHGWNEPYTLYYKVFVKKAASSTYYYTWLAEGSFTYYDEMGISLISSPPNNIYLYDDGGAAYLVTDADTIEVWVSHVNFWSRA